MGKRLRRAFYNGDDIEASTHMAMGPTVAGMGFGSAGVHISHALGCPIAGMVKDWVPSGFGVDEPLVPRGISTVVTAPACFSFTAPTSPEKHTGLADLLGESTAGLPFLGAAMRLPDAIITLMKDVGRPIGLSALGYSEAEIAEMVEGGWKQQRPLVGNARQGTIGGLTGILEESMFLS